MAFLQSIKSDRVWAYRKISYYWDDSFIPLVKELWETEAMRIAHHPAFPYQLSSG